MVHEPCCLFNLAQELPRGLLRPVEHIGHWARAGPALTWQTLHRQEISDAIRRPEPASPRRLLPHSRITTTDSSTPL